MDVLSYDKPPKQGTYHGTLNCTHPCLCSIEMMGHTRNWLLFIPIIQDIQIVYNTRVVNSPGSRSVKCGSTLLFLALKFK